jgi:hypothetical protein
LLQRQSVTHFVTPLNEDENLITESRNRFGFTAFLHMKRLIEKNTIQSSNARVHKRKAGYLYFIFVTYKVFIGSNGQNFRQYNFYVEDERSAIG